MEKIYYNVTIDRNLAGNDINSMRMLREDTKNNNDDFHWFNNESNNRMLKENTGILCS